MEFVFIVLGIFHFHAVFVFWVAVRRSLPRPRAIMSLAVLAIGNSPVFHRGLKELNISKSRTDPELTRLKRDPIGSFVL